MTNPLVQFIIGATFAIALIGACGKEEPYKADFTIIREIGKSQWTGYAQVVKDPIVERCYLRSQVGRGWSYMLLPDCR